MLRTSRVNIVAFRSHDRDTPQHGGADPDAAESR
jgi:hypothetical protein